MVQSENIESFFVTLFLLSITLQSILPRVLQERMQGLRPLYGFGIRCRLWDVEIVLDDMSVPRVFLRNDVGDGKGFEVRASLAHEANMEVGFAVIMKTGC